MSSTDMIIGSLPHKSQAERARMRTNAERLLAKGTPAQQADAAKMLAAMDAPILGERQKLNDLLSSMTIGMRVAEAFLKRPPTETEAKVIQALLDNPGSSSTALSQVCGWGGKIWHTHFGTMCKKREADLWPAEKFETHDANFYSGILADMTPVNRFTMKPDVAAAFAELGLVARVKGAG